MIKVMVAHADFDRAMELIERHALIWSSVQNWIAISDERVRDNLRALTAEAIETSIHRV